MFTQSSLCWWSASTVGAPASTEKEVHHGPLSHCATHHLLLLRVLGMDHSASWVQAQCPMMQFFLSQNSMGFQLHFAAFFNSCSHQPALPAPPPAPGRCCPAGSSGSGGSPAAPGPAIRCALHNAAAAAAAFPPCGAGREASGGDARGAARVGGSPGCCSPPSPGRGPRRLQRGRCCGQGESRCGARAAAITAALGAAPASAHSDQAAAGAGG